MLTSRVLVSKKDSSINLVFPYGKGYLESRLVYRPSHQNHNNHLSLYLSSHSGCFMNCEMCHLTHSNQKSFLPANDVHLTQQLHELLDQFQTNLASQDNKIEWVYLNFMARGEPLLNPTVQERMPELFDEWENHCKKYDLKMRVNISTILPKGIKRLTLQNMFKSTPIHMYYSLYSLDPAFRMKWLPNAIDPFEALDQFKAWEEHSGVPVTFHWPVIDGHNDSPEGVDRIAQAIKARNFKGRYHLVRFNTPSPQYTEASEERMQYVLDTMSNAFPEPRKSKLIQRVGEDVYASCGTFWAPSSTE